MSSVYFSQDHEWILVDGTVGTVGITEYAQEQLGDIVFVEVTKPDAAVTRGEDVAVVESVKAASDIYSPVSGTITDVNTALDAEPAIVNSDAMGDGWLYRMTLSDAAEVEDLMDADGYQAFIATL